jgi:hypothetical protein
MHRRCVLLLNVLLVLGLVVSGQFLAGSPLSSATSEARVAAPGYGITVDGRPMLASKQASRKHHRRDDRQRDRTKADRKQDDKQKERKQDRKRAGQIQEQDRVGDWQEYCTGPDAIPLPRVDFCTHGADPAPAGFDIDLPVEFLGDEAAQQETAALLCEGDGQSGFRVQMLYVYPDNKSSRFGPTLEASLRGMSGQADQIFQKSAEETGSVRNLRFVQESGALCQPDVVEVKIPAASIAGFDTMIAQLQAQGFNRADRIYLAFTDATNYCGVGTIWNDDRLTTANWNYSGPSYSRVDAGCWTGTVAAHEVMLNLGGVQLSAPNTSHGFHCIDEYDVMCYSDAGPGQPQMRVDCQNQSNNATRFDCGHNDYYNTTPAPGSYLANYWNAANNRFLIGAIAPPAPPPPQALPAPSPPDITVVPVKDKKDSKAKSNGGSAHKHKKKKH